MENIHLENFENGLCCPITSDLLDEPISTPCGHAFSRLALATWIESSPSKTCPVCNADLTEFDAMNAPTNIALAGLVESYKNQGEQQVEVIKQDWSSTIIPVIDVNGNTLPIAELKVTLEESMFIAKPTLIILLVDISGSMANSGEKQCRQALIHIFSMIHSNPFVKTVLITYNSFANVVDTSGTLEQVKNMIDLKVRASGGNNEEAGFNLVADQLKNYKYVDDGDDFDDHTVNYVSLIFLTDGQACRSRDQLITILQDRLEEVWFDPWNGPLAIHSIGFTGYCDTAFLEEVRKQGNIEGTFRYASPQDSDDALCLKLQSLFESISESSSVQVNFKLDSLQFKMSGKLTNEADIQFPIKKNKKGTYTQWVKLSPENLEDLDKTEFGSVTIKSSLDDNIPIPITFKKATNRNQKRLLDRWIGTLVDELAAELLDLSKKNKANYGHNVFDLHCALIQQKVESIGLCTESEDISERLEYIASQVELLRNGSGVDANKLGDLRFASQFGAMVKSKPKPKIPTIAQSHKSEPLAIANKAAWKELTVRYSRNNYNKGRNALQEAIMNNQLYKLTSEIKNALENSTLSDILHTDVNGSNALHLAAYCGHQLTVKAILEKYTNLDLELTNDDEETALTLAIKKRGFHNTIGILLDAGAVIPPGRSKSLEQFAINGGFAITAEIISNVGENSGGNEVHESMTPQYIKYSYQKAISKGIEINAQNYLEVCLSKCMVDLVRKMIIKHGAQPTIDMLLKYCIPPKPDDPETDKYIELATLILGKDPDLIKVVDDDGEDCLFQASKKGSLPHVKFFLERGALIDRPSVPLGNTALWIACAKRYPCIIEELLDWGADPNWTNLKGNPPMYNICQRGPKKIAELLLSRGATVDHVNRNGDTMILLCCRNGQYDILELFLDHVDPEFVEFKAHIDGFDALFASVEAGKSECIKVLYEYGVDLEGVIDDTNPILPGASPLNLASYYNKIDAVKTLLSLGANPNSTDAMGRTSLHISILQGHISIIKLLRNGGANIMVKDNLDNTPASYCRNRMDIRKVLVNPALDILMSLAKGGFSKAEERNACDVLRNHCGAIGCLIPKDAVDILGNNGLTPLMEAVIHSNFSVAQVLTTLGSNPGKTIME